MTLTSVVDTPIKHSLYFKEVHIGYAIQDIDGFFYYLPNSPINGYWGENHLRMVADYLEKVNKPWNDKLDELFAKEQEGRTYNSEVDILEGYN